MRLPSQKRIIREDLKDAPDWVGRLIDPVNSFMESVYATLNKNVTFDENLAAFVKEITYKTPSTYPTMNNFEFVSTLKTKATSVMVMQAVEKSTYQPAPGPVYIPWIEENGTIIVSPITGLEADKVYLIRLLVS